jgi:hypothetical protein
MGFVKCLHSTLPIFPLATMMGGQIPDLQFSCLETISACISTTRKSFLEHRSRDVEFRVVQLRKLYWACVLNPLKNE